MPHRFRFEFPQSAEQSSPVNRSDLIQQNGPVFSETAFWGTD
jgi:hypothetical protein